MEREEIERAADSLLALSRVESDDERKRIALAVARRLADIPDDRERALRSHSLVRLMFFAVPWVSRVRFLAVSALGWSHGEAGRGLGVPRSTAQTIVRRPSKRLPWEDEGD